MKTNGCIKAIHLQNTVRSPDYKKQIYLISLKSIQNETIFNL
jgi:hypothetical protein